MTKAQFENHSLQTTTLLTFLTKSPLGKHVQSIDKHQDWFALTLNPSAALEPQLVPKLKRLLTLPKDLQSDITSLPQIITDIITTHSTGEVDDINVCIDAIKRCMRNNAHRLNLETGIVEIETTRSIAAMFQNGLSNNPYIEVNYYPGKLSFKLYPYFLKLHTLCVLALQDQSVLFFNDTWIPRDEILLIEEPLPDGSIQVTPHICLPAPTGSSQFHFVLDSSNSMQKLEKINESKKSRWDFAIESALKLGELIFARDANAKILVNTFDRVSSPITTISTLEKLEKHMRLYEALGADGVGTHLTEACFTKLDAVLKDNMCYHNILLFTDGAESVSNEGKLRVVCRQLKEKLASLTEAQCTRIKFFIISYTDQQPLLKELTQIFNSEFILYQSSGLLDALNDHNQLSHFATRHDLFTIRMTTKNIADTETSNTEYQIKIAQETHIATLDSTQVRPGDHLTITITDSVGRQRAAYNKEISANDSRNDNMSAVLAHLKKLSRFQPAPADSTTTEQGETNRLRLDS